MLLRPAAVDAMCFTKTALKDECYELWQERAESRKAHGTQLCCLDLNRLIQRSRENQGCWWVKSSLGGPLGCSVG